MATRKTNTPEDVKRYLKFFSEHPNLTCAETAIKLKLKYTYTWQLAKDNGFKFSIHTNGGRKNKPKIIEQVAEGFFNLKEYSQSFRY